MLPPDTLVDHNRRGWDSLAAAGHPLTRPVDAAELRRAREILDPCGWLEGDVAGRRVLCLAAGGGRFSALFASLGAAVTVADISDAMLALDRSTAAKFGLEVRCLQSDMCDLRGCGDAEFDLVMQPVSTAYVAEPRFAFAEVARVLRAAGIYVSFHKQPANLQAALHPGPSGYAIERPVGAAVSSPEGLATRLREAGTIEHAHSLQVLLGGLCAAGFAIEAIVEPQYGDASRPPGSFEHRCAYLPPYIAVKARRSGGAGAPARLIV